MLRTPLIRVSSLDELAETAADLSTVILDLDNTMLPYYPTAADFVALRDRVRGLRSSLPPGSALILTTNTRNHPRQVFDAVASAGAQLVVAAGKPRPRRLLAATHRRPTVVVGDQPITDGLLARRLRVPFVLVAGCSLREPLWPKLMRLFGKLVAVRLFSEQAPTESQKPPP